MRYALIGCGRIAANHIQAAIENHLEIVAVCDVVPERMEKILSPLKETKAIKRFTDYQEMINEIKPELVSIAAESGFHAAIALYCLRKEVPVLIEKPMAMSMEEADAIINLSEEKKIPVGVCHQNRFNFAVQEMRKAREAGRFGKISHGSVHIRWNRNQNYYQQAPWRGTWKQDGGALMNQCIHGIDLLCWMMGDEAESVYGLTRQQFHPYLETEDVGVAAIAFRNGAIATIEGTTNVYPENLEETLYLFGEKGSVKLGGKSVNTIELWEFQEKCREDETIRGLKEKTRNVYGNGHSRLFQDMIEAIQKKRSPYVDAYAGRRAVEMVLAIYKSQKEGRKIELPLKRFGSQDMTGEFDHGKLLCT